MLDGISIDINEQIMAKDIFTGRLTEEILLQRLDGFTPQTVQDLDLSGCSLRSPPNPRDFDDIFNDSYFPNLRQLNLNKNMFQNVKIFGEMKKLETLILSQNKIELLYTTSNAEQLQGLNGLQVINLSRTSKYST